MGVTVVGESVGGGCEGEEEEEEDSWGWRSEETDHDGFDKTSSIGVCDGVFDEDRMMTCRDRGG